MRTFDLSPLYRSTVGFDRMFNLLDSMVGSDGAVPTYPPYNIERTGENAYRVTMAVAGFGEDDLSIESKENVLTVKGEKKASEEQKENEFLYRGIASRAFERRFQLADHVEVKGACAGERPAARRARAQHSRGHEAPHHRHQRRQQQAGAGPDRPGRRLTSHGTCLNESAPPRGALFSLRPPPQRFVIPAESGIHAGRRQRKRWELPYPSARTAANRSTSSALVCQPQMSRTATSSAPGRASAGSVSAGHG